MKVIYSSVLCSPEKFKEYFKDSTLMPGQQVQKYHRLIVEGFYKNNIDLEVISAPPISRKNNKKLYFKKEKEKSEGIKYNYLPIINIPILKHLLVFTTGFIQSFRQLQKNKNSYAICDILNVSVASSTLLAAKLLKRKSIGIITDVPSYLAKDSIEVESILKRKFARLFLKTSTFIMNRFDSYIILTEETNDLINKTNKPYIVLEGQVDINMKENENLIKDKYDKRVVMYTGALKEIYGIRMLTEAFIKANVEESELHIYGTGTFAKELIAICKQNSSIKYFGTVPNEIVVREQLKATLLINPRPTSEEYTKYSFPSKNMEYMASGTPTLTTVLAGMPKNYYDYLYLIKEEDIEGLTKELKRILKKPSIELHEKGLRAKEFVIKKKNNVFQVKKIIKMIQTKLSML